MMNGVRHFNESRVDAFSPTERQILSSGLSFLDLQSVVENFRLNGDYILVVYRDMARKFILTMIRIRHLSNGKFFQNIHSESLIDKLSRPINATRRYISKSRREAVAFDMMRLFYHLVAVHTHAYSSLASEIEMHTNKMERTTALGVVEDEDPPHQETADEFTFSSGLADNLNIAEEDILMLREIISDVGFINIFYNIQI